MARSAAPRLLLLFLTILAGIFTSCCTGVDCWVDTQLEATLHFRIMVVDRICFNARQLLCKLVKQCLDISACLSGCLEEQ